MGSKPVKDLSGKRFGRLVVLSFSGWKYQPSGQRKSTWVCQCDCGEQKTIIASSLVQGITKSCDCLYTEAITTHGLSNSPEYKVFGGIMERCNNPKAAYYHCYGELGIKIEGDWALPVPEGFLNFYRDMGQRPSERHTVERVDVTRGYSKDNCIWTDDLSMQSYNQGMDKRNSSGKTGVSFDSGRNKWVAGIGYKNKSIYLGRFDTFEEAVNARECAEVKYYGFTKE